MSWRTVVITQHCKLSYKNGYMVVRSEDIKLIHVSEIRVLLIDTTNVVITTHLISELLKSKVKIVFCDEKRNPQGEIIPYYDSYQSSKKIRQQIDWDKSFTSLVWTQIIKKKILNQSDLMKKYEIKVANKLVEYACELQVDDPTSREGHAAKVYFNALFGVEFNRREESSVNAALNYGYTLILSSVNKEITAAGYLTQLGLKHCNAFNHFNLSSDLMEPLRIYVDNLVFQNKEKYFNSEYKILLLELLSKEVIINNKKQYFSNAISIYVRSVLSAIENKDLNIIRYPEYE